MSINFNTAQAIYYINSILYQFMTYYAFRCVFKPAVKRRWIILAYAVYLILASEIFILHNNAVFNLLVNPIALIGISWLFYGNRLARTTYAVLIYLTSLVADLISFTFLTYIYSKQFNSPLPQVAILSVERTVTNILQLPLLLIFIQIFRYLDTWSARRTKLVPKTYSLAVLLTIICIILLDCLFFTLAIKELEAQAVLIISSQLLACIIVFLIIWFYNTILDYIIEREANRQKAQLFEKWEQQYQVALSSQNTISGYLHNYKYNLMALRGILNRDDESNNEQNVEAALGFIDDLLGSVQSMRTVNTGNNVFDTMIGFYNQKANELLNINITVDLPIPPGLILDAGLVATILGNALENALEACKYVPAQERYIRVSGGYIKQPNINNLILTIENPYSIMPVKNKKGELETTKEDKENHGFGLTSIREMLDHNSGHFNIEYDNDVFRFILILYDIKIGKPEKKTKITKDRDLITSAK